MLIKAKEKISRRYGRNLFLKGERSLSQKSAMIRNPSVPGIKKGRRQRSLSDYGLHLAEKQMIRFSYGVAEKQMRRYFEIARRSQESTAEAFLKILETRLDNAVFRSGLAISRSIARQLVSHGHFLVNNKKVSLPAFNLKAGDVIQPSSASIKMAYFKELPQKIKNFQTPSWIALEKGELKAKILHKPKTEEVENPFDFQLLVEYYSK